MLEQLRDYAHTHREAAYMLLRHYLALDRPLLLQSALQDEFRRFCDGYGGRTLGNPRSAE